MPPFKLDSVYTPTADQPEAIESLAEGIERGRRGMTLLGATGTGKTMTMAATIEAVQRPGADHRPQQDARRAAVQRVPHVLPAERGRVLRLLLRLLPARGLRPVEGPLHREGLGDQPGDRPAAPRRDGGAVRPARRGHRRARCRASSASARRRPTTTTARSSSRAAIRTATRCCASSSPAVQPQRHGARARHVPRARRHAGGLPGLRRDRVPRAAVRRRGRAPAALRPADGRADRRRPRARRDLAGHALQRQGGDDGARGGGDRPGAQRAPPGSRPRASCSSRTGCASARSTTWRCCARSGSARASRTTRGSSTGGARLAPVLPARLLPRGLRLLHRRVPPDRAADRRHVRGRPLAQVDAGRLRLPAAVGDGQPPADLRGVPLDHAADGVRVGDARGSTSATTRRRSSSRSCGRPASSTPTSRSARRTTRSTT